MANNAASDKSAVPKKHNLTMILLSCLAILLLLIASLGTWAKNNLFDTKAFSEHVVTAVQTESVRNALAGGVTDKLYANFPIAERLLANPTKSFISSQLATERAGNILDKLAENLQNRAIRGNSKPVVVDISGFTDTLAAIRQTIAPNTEPRFELPQGDAARIVILKGDEIPNLQNAGMFILTITPLAFAGLIAIAVVGWFKVGRKTRYFKIMGTIILVTGAALLIFTYTTSSQLSLLANNANQATILESVYNEFIGNLQRWQSVLLWTGLGIIVVASLVDHRQAIASTFKKLRPNNQKAS